MEIRTQRTRVTRTHVDKKNTVVSKIVTIKNLIKMKKDIKRGFVAVE